ncbi:MULTISPECIES: ornithinee aminotransferase [Rothia]|uniref:ornithinee aminotransferase n=1 Tax=Rothia TaxID=32207 RepID=UPI001CAD99D6|nr:MULTISPECIES: ornithinee aminotransferase [Rothia]MBF1665128.1 ornithinee aminotransferase [Rothia sp. (in: high G+C Gram-positive bacteria)]MBF1667720.1 ornithinee aminotransferase [Rothia sp. (in: high G+C Gram-positive bacteria)]MBS6979575.1 ornithinee aminotransferase [Rothia mucilaginosa]
MSFFGIGKKKLDEQSREEQSAETAKAQKEQASEDAPKSARLSEKIMEQQQWEDSLRRFVKSESARHQNQDDEQSEEYRAVEDLKRALLHDDEQVEENPSAEELTEEQVEEQERRSLLAALGAFPQESEEPIEVEQVAEVQDIEEDAAPVAEAPEPATPAFLRDDEEVTSEAEEASVDAEEPKDAAEDARSQFEKHLRAVRAQNSEDEVEESEIASADAEDTLTADDMKAARTRAAVTEAQNAGLDDLAAAYAARLGITLDSEEETFSEVASDEVAAEETTTEVVAEDADSAESAEITEPVEEAEEEQIEAVVEAPELLAAEIADEENAVSDETELLSAVSVEEKRDVSVSEAPEAKDFDAEEENTAELIFDASAVEESTLEETAVEEPATKIEDSAAEGTESAEDEPAKSSSVAPALAAGAAPVVVAAAVASAAKTEKAEEKTEKGTSQGVALTAEGIDKKEAEKHEATSATGEESAEEPAAELKEAEQKLSEDEAELVAESIILSAPVEGAATLPALPEQRALHGLAELMRTRGSGTMSLELRQVDEDMHYRLLHRGREVETGIVVPGVDWFAPVAALYTEAQQAGATWNRAAVSLNPRLGDGLEVHASYLGMADGQTTRESFLLEGTAVEAKPVATAEAAEATSQDEPQEAAVQSVDPIEAEREAIERELEAELAEKQAANEAEAAAEAAEEPVVETAEEGASVGLLTAAGLAAAGTAVAGSAASAQEKNDVEEVAEASDEPAAQPAQTEFAPVEAEFEHDYENDSVFGAATVEPETEHAEESAAEAVEASAEDSVEPGEDMEAALATIVANAQKKLDAEEEAPAAVAEEAPAEEVAAVEDQKVAAPVVAESFTLNRTQPVEESAEEPVAEKAEEPALPAFLDDSELLPEQETSTEAASAEASAEAPALEDAEPVSESASVAPGLAGALAAAAAVGTAGAAAKAAGAQEETAEKGAELKTVEVTPAAKIAEAPASAEPASEATAQTAPAAPVAEAAPAAATTPVALPESTPAGISSSISASALSELNQLPTIVAEPDTPSAAVQSPLVPSETQLASGNLVLTEAQVAQRLAPVVEHLFGENGTAKDATTVLIRVRALGSYYDALTHVRRNGFWEQVRTFELIPETLLDIPALKTDSYSEGEGSPLAMSLTFTPGVPVQAAFDYANEQAFVTYPRPLDAERYVEELRMFPRLGSKIPAHMTSALSHWNL